MFDRQQAIRDFRARAVAAGLTKAWIIELEDHLLTTFELAVAAGEPAEAAFTRAIQDLGGVDDLAHEFHKDHLMHPVSKLFGLSFAMSAIVGSLWLLGGHPTILLALPPFLMVVGLSLGGLCASHGPVRLWRLVNVALGHGAVAPGEQTVLQRMCRRGHRLAYAAGFLSLLFGVIHVFSVLDDPALIGPGIAYALLGLVQGVLVAELGFANAEHWVTRDTVAAPPGSLA